MADSPGHVTQRTNTPIVELPDMTVAAAARFGRLDIATVADLLRHLPARYEHEAAETAITDLKVGTLGATRGLLSRCRPVPAAYRRKGRFEAVLEADSACLQLIWFNAGYLRDSLHPGMRLRVQGKVQQYRNQVQMANPRWQRLEDDDEADPPTLVERLRPVYPATDGLPSRTIEQVIEQVLKQVLPHLDDPLPQELIEHHQMPALAEAFRMAHQPQSLGEAGAARRRLSFNELLLLQMGIAMKRAFVRDRLVAAPLEHGEAIDQHIRARFPFALTPAQDQVIGEMVADLTQSRPMNRLLQGDVGSGKTVVALYALLMAVAARRQGALMAPTELLAEQHHDSIGRMLTDSNVQVGLLTAGMQAAKKQIASGELDIVVGTHALISESVQFKDLAVVVIDEQHRFGVMQRAALRAGDGQAAMIPHHLVMTATPIPRTLSLTVFGDLDVSTIAGLPPGRTPITSRVVGPEKAGEVYAYVQTRLQRDEQAYVVVPTIDATGEQSAQQLKNVRGHAKLLQETYFPAARVESVHGRLQRPERQRIMDQFRKGKIQVLVATTVIEVGMDVPNATVMIVEHAERFGLAQLHQLRGRVGRGTQGRRSLCVFIADPTTDEAGKRMDAIASTSDGFKIAEMDLAIRGMGEFFGTRQHGAPPLRIARIPQDMELLLLARRDAEAIIEQDPLLKKAEHETLRKLLLQQFGEALGLIDVG